jgi:hypothetical protein
MIIAKQFSLSVSGREAMGIVYPSKAVAHRWDGALQARLRRAPVEQFLRAHSLLVAPAGRSQDSDNLVRATVFIAEAGLARYVADREEGAFIQRSGLSIVACLVSLGLAQQFSQSDAWRNVALVSAARLLSPWIGLDSAALLSAAVARQFQQEIKKGISPLDWRVITSATDAVSENGPDALLKAALHIATRLRSEPSVGELSPAKELRAPNQRF